MQSFVSIFQLSNLVFFLGFIAFTIYLYVLAIKLARRGIKALDLYINEKTNNRKGIDS